VKVGTCLDDHKVTSCRAEQNYVRSFSESMTIHCGLYWNLTQVIEIIITCQD